jgi:hypothetical protein
MPPWETWEWVVFISLFIFGLGGPLWAAHMLKNPPEPPPEPNAELAAKAFEEAKNKVASVPSEEVRASEDKAPAENPTPLLEAAEPAK